MAVSPSSIHLIVRNADGTVKLLVYRKASHTDQYLNYHSHHPLHQKLGVVRTLYDRKNNIVSEDKDKAEEEQRVNDALKVCGYPEWSFEKVKSQMEGAKQKKDNTRKKASNTENSSRGKVVLPYVKGVTERVARVMKAYNIDSAMSPHNTLRRELVHPKDKRDQLNTCNAIYEAPCKNCELTYIGETGRKFGKRLEEHKAEVEKVSEKIATRASRKESITTTHKSAITDHVADKNHVIGWTEAKVIGTEENRYKRWIKEAIEIRKRGGKTMNRDEGQYQLTHIFDELLVQPSGSRSKSPKETTNW